jgi:hypothetical protein
MTSVTSGGPMQPRVLSAAGQIPGLHRQRWPQPGTRHQYAHERGDHDDQALHMDSSGNPGQLAAFGG